MQELGIIHDGMTGREVFEASKKYWAEYYKNRAKKRKVVYRTQPWIVGCKCEGAGWYLLDVDKADYRHGQLQRCQCNGAGTSFKKSLDVFGDDTFDTFDLARPMANYRSGEHTITADFQKQRLQKAFDVLSNDEYGNGKSYYLWGNVGCGKSHLARAWAIRFSEMGCGVMYRILPSLIDELRHAVKLNTVDTIIERLANVDVLVLDDVGAEDDHSDWIRGRIFRIIDGRTHRKTLYTSNVDPADLYDKLDERIADRINQAQRLWMPLQSYRQVIREKGKQS